jgi:hypothetical protein
MPSLTNPKFAHRPNRDGSFDSVCRRCYVTVGWSEKEAKLESLELLHDCNPKILAMRELELRQFESRHREA